MSTYVLVLVCLPCGETAARRASRVQYIYKQASRDAITQKASLCKSNLHTRACTHVLRPPDQDSSMALLVGTTKQASPMIAMLLLALVAVAAADGTAHGGHGHAPLTGMTQCVTSCGTDVTACFLECYKPPVNSADPAALPICLLNCTNNAMICANRCSSNII
jgi:hypothetical protein